MPKTPAKKPSVTRKSTKNAPKKAAAQRPKVSLRQRVKRRIDDLLSRRPHRSFQMTRRRDYRRSLVLPGYIAFTYHVWSTLWSRKKVFFGLVLTYTILGVFLGTMTSQDTYNQMSGLVQNFAGDFLSGNVGAIIQAGSVSVATFMGGSNLTDVQKVYIGIMFMLTWLTTVWLLREYLAGRSPRLRDGIYSSASPIIPTVLVALWFLAQLLPVGVVSILFSGLVGAGLLTNGFGAFIFSMIAILLVSLSLYWITSTFIALVVVTLPGMYPMQAMRAAGDLVIGRRLRILYRILWLALIVAVTWLAVMIPVVLLDTWLQHKIEWLAAIPWVPFIALLLGAATTVWSCSYVYLLYRKVVEDDARPA